MCVEKPGLRIFVISGPSRREDGSASVARPPCQCLVGILPCDGEGMRGCISPREGFSAGKHAIHFLFMYDPKYLNDLEHVLENYSSKCSWVCVYAGIPFPLYLDIHASRRNLISNGTLVPQIQLRLSFPWQNLKTSFLWLAHILGKMFTRTAYRNASEAYTLFTREIQQSLQITKPCPEDANTHET